MPREEDAMRGKDAHIQATKREESSNIPVLPIFQLAFDFSKSLIIDSITI